MLKKSNVRFQKYGKIFHKASVLMTRLNSLDWIRIITMIELNFLGFDKVMTIIIIYQ